MKPKRSDILGDADRHRAVEAPLVADERLQQILDRGVDDAHDRRLVNSVSVSAKNSPPDEVPRQRADAR